MSHEASTLLNLICRVCGVSFVGGGMPPEVKRLRAKKLDKLVQAYFA